MEAEYANVGQAGKAARETHLVELGGKLGQVQDMASRLEGDLQELGDRLLGGEPPSTTDRNVTPVPSTPCSGAVGDLFERTNHLHGRLTASLQYLDRLKRIA